MRNIHAGQNHLESAFVIIWTVARAFRSSQQVSGKGQSLDHALIRLHSNWEDFRHIKYLKSIMPQVGKVTEIPDTEKRVLVWFVTLFHS